MPAPLNFTNREFADETRPPAASLARALSEMYEAFALIEENDLLGASNRLKQAADKAATAKRQMEGITGMQPRWDVTSEVVFEKLLDEFADVAGSMPMGDESMADQLAHEVANLKTALATYAASDGDFPAAQESPKPIPVDAADQAMAIRTILTQALKVQQMGLLATQISMVSKGAPMVP